MAPRRTSKSMFVLFALSVAALVGCSEVGDPGVPDEDIRPQPIPEDGLVLSLLADTIRFTPRAGAASEPSLEVNGKIFTAFPGQPINPSVPMEMLDLSSGTAFRTVAINEAFQFLAPNAQAGGAWLFHFSGVKGYESAYSDAAGKAKPLPTCLSIEGLPLKKGGVLTNVVELPRLRVGVMRRLSLVIENRCASPLGTVRVRTLSDKSVVDEPIPFKMEAAYTLALGLRRDVPGAFRTVLAFDTSGGVEPMVLYGDAE